MLRVCTNPWYVPDGDTVPSPHAMPSVTDVACNNGQDWVRVDLRVRSESVLPNTRNTIATGISKYWKFAQAVVISRAPKFLFCNKNCKSAKCNWVSIYSLAGASETLFDPLRSHKQSLQTIYTQLHSKPFIPNVVLRTVVSAGGVQLMEDSAGGVGGCDGSFGVMHCEGQFTVCTTSEEKLPNSPICVRHHVPQVT